MIRTTRGVTLVELMIVVAIIGILASIGSVAYGRYVKSAKVEKLKTYALTVASGQERYKARNNFYWAGGDYVANRDGFVNLMDFAVQVPATVQVQTEGWDGTGATCNICEGISFDDSVAGFAVRVRQDLDTSDAPQSTIVVTHIINDPVLLNEGR